MLEEREQLLGVARAIGSSAVRAERVLNETYLRWYELGRSRRATVFGTRQWLIRTATGIAQQSQSETGMSSDGLGRPTRHGQPSRSNPRFGPENAESQLWLPTGLTDEASATVRKRIIARFVAACAHDDRQGLLDLLADDVLAVCDGGAHVRAAVRPIRGATEVARFLADLLFRQPELELEVALLNGRGAVVVRLHGRVVGLLNFTVGGSEVTYLWILLNPTRLRGWSHA